MLCCVGFQYETAMGCENPGSIQPGSEEAEVILSGCENPSSVQPVAYHMVNRRYSEFLNLQTRLEEKTELRKLIKGRKDGLFFDFDPLCGCSEPPVLIVANLSLVWLEGNMQTWICCWIIGHCWNDAVCLMFSTWTNIQDFLVCKLCFRCQRSKENFPRHALWKHGQWQNRGQERTSGDLSKGKLIDI